MKLNGKEIAPYESKYIPEGMIGLSPAAKSRVGLNHGDTVDLVFNETGDIKSFKVINAWLSDILNVEKKTEYHSKNIAFVSPGDFEDLESIFKAKEQQEEQPSWVPSQKIPYTRTDKGIIVICASKNMDTDIFPDYTLRMDDRTRKELGQTWNTPWVIHGRRYTVRPAIVRDLESIESYHLPARVVFMHKDSVPEVCEAFNFVEVTSDPKTTDDDVKSLRILKESTLIKTLGEDLAKDIELDLQMQQRSKEWLAKLDYKVWASGVNANYSSVIATERALKVLREDLVKVRDRINETIDRIHPD